MHEPIKRSLPILENQIEANRLQENMASKIALVCITLAALMAVFFCNTAEAGVPLVGYGGNTFNEIFSTGFQNGLGGYGAGTVAGAVGYYGQFTGIGQVGVGQTLSAKGSHYGRR